MNNFATTADPFGALTIASFCQRYGIKRSFFYSEREAGRIAVRKAGKRVLVSVAEAERWFRGLPDPAEEPKRAAARLNPPPIANGAPAWRSRRRPAQGRVI